MSGVMAGSAALKSREQGVWRGNLSTVTLTVNNTCQLRCPHCYLNYNNHDSDVMDDVVRLLRKSEFERLAIVGKEPFANAHSVELCKHLIQVCRERNVAVSIITNGIGLRAISPEILTQLEYLDVSMDGGAASYQKYRQADFSKLMTELTRAKASGLRELNVLHAIFAENAQNIGDMLEVRNYCPLDKMLFSPYLETENAGTNLVTMLSPERYLAAFAPFRKAFHSNDSVLISKYYLDLFSVSADAAEDIVAGLGLVENVVILGQNPLEQGMIRVTFDGRILTPYQSLHPARYSECELTVPLIEARDWSLNDVLEEMRKWTPEPRLAS